MYRFISSCLLLLTCASCTKQLAEYNPFNEEQVTKPTVAILPIIDKALIDLPWNISEEITNGVREHIQAQGKLDLSSGERMNFEMSRLQGKDLFSQDTSFTKALPGYDFVAILELIEHQNVPYTRQRIKPLYTVDGEVSRVLMMTARVKVLDLRHEKPQVVLEEVLHSNHLIPKRIAHVTPKHVKWGDFMYKSSPIGIGHARLERDIALRVTEYVLPRL